MRLLIAALAALALAGCFPRSPGARLQHFADEAPAPGEAAPALELLDLDGRPLALADLLGDRPVVLQLGSHSCPVYRYRRFGMQRLYEDWGEKAHFLVVYVQEAHPQGSPSPFSEEEWVTPINRVTRQLVGQPATDEERLAQARRSHEALDLEMPMAVDSISNSAWSTLGRAASPAFVLDRHGKVVLRQVWVHPKEIRAVLEDLLSDPAE